MVFNILTIFEFKQYLSCIFLKQYLSFFSFIHQKKLQQQLRCGSISKMWFTFECNWFGAVSFTINVIFHIFLFSKVTEITMNHLNDNWIFLPFLKNHFKSVNALKFTRSAKHVVFYHWYMLVKRICCWLHGSHCMDNPTISFYTTNTLSLWYWQFSAIESKQ